MSNEPLHAQQAKAYSTKRSQEVLIRALTCGTLNQAEPAWQALLEAHLVPNNHIGRLASLAQFAHLKRIEKVARSMPTTVRLLDRSPDWGSGFAVAHPPFSGLTVIAALQIYRWLRETDCDDPPWIVDVAWCEVAVLLAAIRPKPNPIDLAQIYAMRRTRKLLAFEPVYDIRPLLAGGKSDPVVNKTGLTLAALRRNGIVSLVEVGKDLMEMLRGLDDWTPLPREDGSRIHSFVVGLSKAGLMECLSVKPVGGH